STANRLAKSIREASGTPITSSGFSTVVGLIGAKGTSAGSLARASCRPPSAAATGTLCAALGKLQGRYNHAGPRLRATRIKAAASANPAGGGPGAGCRTQRIPPSPASNTNPPPPAQGPSHKARAVQVTFMAFSPASAARVFPPRRRNHGLHLFQLFRRNLLG